MFLEQWIQRRISQEARDNPELHRDIVQSKLDSFPNDAVGKFQLFKLRRALRYVYQESTFYRQLFRKHSVAPWDLETLSDLSRLPFTTGSDLVNFPYQLLCVPLSKVTRIFTLNTSGTSGQPKKVFFTLNDVERIAETVAAIINTVVSCSGLTAQGSAIQIFLPNGTPVSQRNLVAKGVEKLGAFPVAGDTAATTQEQIQSIEAAKPIMLLGSASRIYRLTQEARQFHRLSGTGVKIVLITSEYLSPGMRKNLEDFWEAQVYHHYGMTEAGLAVAIECPAHNGFHFDEADFFFEIVDPVTGKVLPDGEEGELVLTTLNREGMPLIRYRTGDISRLLPGRCSCGASTRKIDVIAKRTALMVNIGKETQIYPALFDNVLYAFPDVIDYRVILISEGNKDCLICRVELTSERASFEKDLSQAIMEIPQIRQNVEANRLTPPRVELAKTGQLRREGRTKQRIIDKRMDSTILYPSSA
jgi:phenylacetate-coenzyme A ligase PaaK-like adenylate-forming protein